MISSYSTRPITQSSRLGSKSCLVPLFLSTRAQRDTYARASKTARSQRSHASTRDMIDADAPQLPQTTYTPDGRAHSPAHYHATASEEQAEEMYAPYFPPQRQDTSTVSLPMSNTAPSTMSSTPSRTASSTSSSSTNSKSKPTSKPKHRHHHHHHRHHNHNPSSSNSSHSYSSSARRPRRKITQTALLHHHASSKLHLTISFTITTFVSLIIYLALFLSRTARGAAFHILSILLLLSLAAVALHSLLRWLMLKREYEAAKDGRDRKRKSPRERGWTISRPFNVKHGKGVSDVLSDGEVPREGMRVFMHEDEPHAAAADLEAGYGVDETRARHEGADVGYVELGRLHGLAGNVRPPPPVYGNFRDSVVSHRPQDYIVDGVLTCSQRMDPARLHTHAISIPPSPSTPSYEQALNNVGSARPYTTRIDATVESQTNGGQRRPNVTGGPAIVLPGMPGFRPPSYGSEGGLTAVLETRRRDVVEGLKRVHPLERQRLDRLGFRI